LVRWFFWQIAQTKVRVLGNAKVQMKKAAATSVPLFKNGGKDCGRQ
jgi:hypothetical protein